MFKSQPIIFIYVDALRRDLLVANILKEKLEKINFQVFLISRENYQKILKIFTPDGYIVIKNFLKNFENDISHILKSTHTIVVDAEGAMNEERCHWHLKNLGLDLDKVIPNIKKSFVWNSNFKKFIEKHIAAEADKIEVVGSTKISISKVIKDIKFKKSKTKNIGFVGRFNCINSFDKTTALETSLVRLFENDFYKHGAIGELRVLETYIEIIKKILNETNYTVSIRPHPNENFYAWEKFKRISPRVQISNKYEDFLEWMNYQNIIIATPSTSIVEPLINNIPLISVHKITNSTGIHDYFENMLQPFIENIETPGNVDEVIKILKDDNFKNNEFSRETISSLKEYYDYDAETGKTAINQIIDYLKKQKLKKSNFSRTILIKLIYYAINLTSYLKIRFFKSQSISAMYDFNYFLHKNENQFAKKVCELDDRF